MMEPNHTRLCATAAIAAALALASTPLSAQVAEAPPPVAPDPVLTLPTAPAPPPAQPTVVVPTELPPAPQAEAPAPDPAPRDAARAERPAPRAAALAPARVTAPDPEPVAAEEDLAPVAAEPVTEAVAPVAVSEPAVAPAVPETDNTPFWIAVLAGLAAFALAMWGFVAIGRRKPVDRKAAMMIERPVVKPREPVAQPVAAEPVPTPSVSPLHPAGSAPSMAHTGAAVPLPSRVPESFEERDALIKRMIEAKPDRANPFTSPIQRRKRAKLILQSLGRDFGDAEPWIDLGQYPQNWPELARRNQAAA